MRPLFCDRQKHVSFALFYRVNRGVSLPTTGTVVARSEVTSSTMSYPQAITLMERCEGATNGGLGPETTDVTSNCALFELHRKLDRTNKVAASCDLHGT